MDAGCLALARRAGTLLEARGWRLATAESCTGGGVAQAMTEAAGSSAWFDSGIVTYSNDAKQRLLGVPVPLIDRHGAVSLPVAEAMVRGALARTGADVVLAITGIAGPSGGSPDKPLGTVCFAWCFRNEAPRLERRRFGGDRADVRQQAITHALTCLVDMIGARTVP